MAAFGQRRGSGDDPDGSTSRIWDPGSRCSAALRMSHDDQLVLSDRVTIATAANICGRLSTANVDAAARGEVAVQLGRRAGSLDASLRPTPGRTRQRSDGNSSRPHDPRRFPTVLFARAARTENNLHEEARCEHTASANAPSLARPCSTISPIHTAVMGRGGDASPDFLQDYFFAGFAYDGGGSARPEFAWCTKSFGRHARIRPGLRLCRSPGPGRRRPESSCGSSLHPISPERGRPISRLPSASERSSPRATSGSTARPSRSKILRRGPLPHRSLSEHASPPASALLPGHMEVQADIGQPAGAGVRANVGRRRRPLFWYPRTATSGGFSLQF